MSKIKTFFNNNLITLYGYTSCSLKKEEAIKFMWENKDTGHHKVLFHIQWDMPTSHYYMNCGAYDHEEEVLLHDGVDLKVVSVTEEKDKDGKTLYTLISFPFLKQQVHQQL